jgi:hypothetical protein
VDGVDDLRFQHHRFATEAEVELDLDHLAHLELLRGADEGATTHDVALVLLSEDGGIGKGKAETTSHVEHRPTHSGTESRSGMISVPSRRSHRCARRFA